MLRSIVKHSGGASRAARVQRRRAPATLAPPEDLWSERVSAGLWIGAAIWVTLFGFRFSFEYKDGGTTTVSHTVTETREFVDV